MSLSSSQVDANKPSSASEPLSIPQALLITAGLAGLVGLLGGAFIRFSLANSPNAQFLSPLQTFPALSNWTPGPPQETVDAGRSPGAGESGDGEGDRPRNSAATQTTILTFEPAEPIESSNSKPISESLDTNVSEAEGPLDITTFDTFANRAKGHRRRNDDPLDLLQKGPNLSIPRQSNSPGSALPYDEPLQDRASQGDIYDDSERYADESNGGYTDDGYADEDYTNNYDSGSRYEDNYYPSVDAPAASDDAYYDSDR